MSQYPIFKVSVRNPKEPTVRAYFVRRDLESTATTLSDNVVLFAKLNASHIIDSKLDRSFKDCVISTIRHNLAYCYHFRYIQY